MIYEKPRIGVYICHCGTNISPKVDVEAVAQFAAGLDNVAVARDYKFMCSSPGQEFIVTDILEKGLNRVVVASCSPRMHEPTFRRACEKAGISPHLFQMANIREQTSWVTADSVHATQKAKDQVAAAVSRVAGHAALTIREVAVQKSILVIGGGIAGIQAALTAAEAGYDVYLVEREPSIGGHMAKFDKTFPTLDCAACIMTPKMVEVAQNPKIRLFSYSEVVGVSGFIGNYTVTIRQKPRYVDGIKCTGCGECTKVCPVTTKSEWDMGLGQRKAVYRSFPQSVPNTFCIDRRDRAPCTVSCPAGVNVQGYVQMARKGDYQRAYDIIRETLPLPGVLGRVCPHPCETVCRRAELDDSIGIRELKRFVADQIDPATLPIPEIIENGKKVAVIGSGPAGLTVAHDLRRRGCGVTLFEALPKLGGMLRTGIPDYRLPSAILDAEIDVILRLGIEARIGVRFGQDLTLQDLIDEGFDAVFLGIGAHGALRLNIPGEDIAEGVVDAVRFLREVNLDEGDWTTMIGKSVTVIGGGNVAVDAARVARRLGAASVTVVYRRSEAEMPAYLEEIVDAETEGIGFAYLTAPVRIVEKNGKVTGLECVRTELGLPDDSGRRRPEPVNGSETVLPCDWVIPAIGQRIEAPWAQDLPDLTWTLGGTISVAPETLQTSIPRVFAGGDAVSGPASVVEAVAAGHRAAEAIYTSVVGGQWKDNGDKPKIANLNSQSENPDYLPIPDGLPLAMRRSPSHLDPAESVQSFAETGLGLSENDARSEAERCLNCGSCCECRSCEKSCEAGAIDFNQSEETVEVVVGAVIAATGFQAFDPTPMTAYGYGIFSEVYTSLEFERLNNATGPTAGKILMKSGKPPQRVAIIHCVGSRDRHYRKYCSRVCCMYSMKFAHLVREKTGAEVWEFYIDMRSPGKLYEEFYNRVQEEGVHLIRGRVAQVTDIPDHPEDAGRLVVVAENTLARRVLRVPVDMVILSVGLEPAAGSDAVSRMLGIQRDADGWYNELHAKMAPVKTAVAGIFLAGCCQGPKDIPDTVAQASAAAGEAVSLLSKGTVRTLAEISYIDPDRCSGCRTCIDMCSYSAISFDEGAGVAVVNDALCQGCGSCAAACPSSAAGIRHFEDCQIMAELDALA